MRDKRRDEQERRGRKRDTVMTTGAARRDATTHMTRDMTGVARVVRRGTARHMMKGLTKVMTRDVARVAARDVTVT